MKTKHDSGYALKQLALTNGDRIWLLVGGDGVPDFESTVFLGNLYQERNAANTLRNIANAVRVVKLFEKKYGICIARNIEEGHILSRYQTERLIAECGRSFAAQDEAKSKEKGRVVPISKHGAKEIRQHVVPNTHQIRAYYVACYVKFLVDSEIERTRCQKETTTELQLALARFQEFVSKLSPRRQSLNFDPERPLTPEDAQKILQLRNTEQRELASLLYKQEATRKRNLLIVEVLISTGVRVSEVAGLCTRDVDEDSQILWFRSDKKKQRLDTRQTRPGFKTRGRPIKVNADLIHRLCDYITARKGGRPRIADHPMIFCATGDKAAALSPSSYYRIVCTLKRAFGENWNRRISPHVLRHTFFDMWFREANRKYDFKNHPDLFDQVVAAAELTGGWQPDSKMINHYRQRYVFEQANEVTLRTQRRMMRGG